MKFSRRHVMKSLGYGGFYGTVDGLGPRAFAATKTRAQTLNQLDNSDSGVASAYPDQTSVQLWTRVPTYGRGEADADFVPIVLQIASSPEFTAESLLQEYELEARAAKFYTVQHQAEGLEPGKTYYYRFFTPYGYDSVIGRTRTLPDPAEARESQKAKFAVLSCQCFQDGYFHAYDALNKEDWDFLIFLGDFVYEFGSISYRNLFFPSVRQDKVTGSEEAETLQDYRLKYLLYLSDPALREARARYPWFQIWDDHEIFDNYAGASMPREHRIRQYNAYKAFSEFIPVRSTFGLDADGFASLKLYDRFAFGSLLDIVLTDLRQYRNTEPGKKTTLGSEQKRWLLEDGLPKMDGTWTFMMNQMPFMPLTIGWALKRLLPFEAFPSFQMEGGAYKNQDAWDGFAKERDEVIASLKQSGRENTFILTGDIHSFYTGNIHENVYDTKSPVRAVELITASVSSKNIRDVTKVDWTASARVLLSGTNPHIPFFNLRYHGFLAVDVTHQSCSVKYQALTDVRSKDFELFTLKEFHFLPGAVRV